MMTQKQQLAVDTPIGSVQAHVERGAVVEMRFASPEPVATSSSNDTIFGEWMDRTRRYFAGDLGAFDDAVLDPSGTDFQRKVWQALRRIPAGQTITYKKLAQQVRRPGAWRAVAAACRANPILLAIPCHRVVRENGDLAGYSAGVERKRWLLEHEGGAR